MRYFSASAKIENLLIDQIAAQREGVRNAVHLGVINNFRPEGACTFPTVGSAVEHDLYVGE